MPAPNRLSVRAKAHGSSDLSATSCTCETDRNTVPATVATPTFPSSIRIIAIRRRTGWFTTLSASLVVYPTPV